MGSYRLAAVVRRGVSNTDPMATDPGRWGHSLGNLAELWLELLDAVAPRSIIEVGAYAGDVTRVLIDWANGSEVRIFSIDPDPQPTLVELAETNPGLELVRSPSLEALPSSRRPTRRSSTATTTTTP